MCKHLVSVYRHLGERVQTLGRARADRLNAREGRPLHEPEDTAKSATLQSIAIWNCVVFLLPWPPAIPLRLPPQLLMKSNEHGSWRNECQNQTFKHQGMTLRKFQKSWASMERRGKSWLSMESRGKSWVSMESRGKSWVRIESWGKSSLSMESRGKS